MYILQHTAQIHIRFTIKNNKHLKILVVQQLFESKKQIQYNTQRKTIKNCCCG